METVARTTTKRVASAGGGGPAVLCDEDFLLRWGNRKRLRCVKTVPHEEQQNNDKSASATASRAGKKPHSLRRTSSPNFHRYTGYNTRNAEASAGVRAQQRLLQSGGGHGEEARGRRGEKGAGGAAGNGEGGGSSSSGGGEATVWPRFVIALSSREKEEDFLAFKGSKLPQRPKKRAKCIQRILNQVSPGTWLADVSLERYEVREKKASKKVKKQRGLKAMETILSESE